jgi:hypothetical protein
MGKSSAESVSRCEDQCSVLRCFLAEVTGVRGLRRWMFWCGSLKSLRLINGASIILLPFVLRPGISRWSAENLVCLWPEDRYMFVFG